VIGAIVPRVWQVGSQISSRKMAVLKFGLHFRGSDMVSACFLTK
jgi:hypothetical protein